MNCQHCGKGYTNNRALGNHESRCSSNPNRKIQTIKSQEMRQKTNDILSERTKTFYSVTENREKQSIRMKQVVLDHPESYSDNNIVGRSKHFTVNGVRYNSQWEYEVAQFLDNQSIKWVRTGLTPVPYQWKEKWHLYFPDFYLPDYDVYVEVKGYETDRDRAKWTQADKKVIVIKETEIKAMKSNTYNMVLI